VLASAKAFALLQKERARDPAAVTASETLEIAAGLRSGLLDGKGLVAGAPADFLLVRSDDPELALGALDAGLVYAASGSIVDTTVVAGRVLMRGGVVEDTADVVGHARERAERLGLTGAPG